MIPTSAFSGCRGYVDDPASAAGFHDSNDALAAKKGPLQIDGHDSIPFLGRDFGDRGCGADARIVYQDVDEFEGLDRFTKCVCHVLGFRDVDGQSDCCPVHFAEVVGGPLGCLQIDIPDSHLGAFSSES
jgi:hypothetical protein